MAGARAGGGASLLRPPRARYRADRPRAVGCDLLGLALRRRPPQALDDKGGTPAKPNGESHATGWLGAELAAGAKLVVASVREDGPAWRAGLYAGDEIVAESGFRVDRAGLWDWLRERGPRGALRLTVFRADELVEVEVPLSEAPEDSLWLEPLSDPTPLQRAAFEAWCGAPFPRR